MFDPLFSIEGCFLQLRQMTACKQRKNGNGLQKKNTLLKSAAHKNEMQFSMKCNLAKRETNANFFFSAPFNG